MLAGDVRVAAFEGAIFVRGDAEANQIEVVKTEEFSNSVTIKGVDGTTINGEAEFTFEGADAVVSRGFRINMGPGDDSVRLEGVEAEGRTFIFVGTGDDSVGLYQSTFDEVIVHTHTGDDLVSFDDVIAYDDVRVFTLEGDDTVGIDQLRTFGNTLIVTSEGDDRLAIQDSAGVQGSLLVLTLDGDDFVGIENSNFTQESGVFTGNGLDEVSINDSTFTRRTIVAGQGDSDSIAVSGTTNAGTIVERAFEDSLQDGLAQTSAVYTDLIVDGIRLGTITELAVLTPELSTLVGALQQTGLDAALNDTSGDPLTAFAPLDSAFELLDDGVLAGLSDAELTDILLFHVSPGETRAAELVTLDSVDTLLEQSFTVEVTDAGVLLNGNVTLAATDIRAKNGVIHLIERVLLPA
jgi:uncharacterized surface protein with fasciclin (FAS1) repeats